MGTKTLAVLGFALALGACGKSGNSASGNGAAAGNAAAPSATASAGTQGGGAATGGNIQLNPGEWESTSEMTISGLGNLPPEAARAMQGLSQKTTTRHCLTPEKAQHPGGDLFSGKQREGCSHEGFTFAGGRVKGSMTCKDPRGMASTVTMDGQYGSDNFEVTMKMTASGEGRAMTWNAHTVGRRIGACPPGGDKED
jgi:hypothetical protein